MHCISVTMGDPEHIQPSSLLADVTKSPGSDADRDISEAASTGSLPERYGFPRQGGQSRSYWLQGVQGDALLDHRTTPKVPPSADIVIIGSGLTGTLVAKHCLEKWPEKNLVVIEAREFCSGATGRNAGHCKPDQYRGFKKYEDAFGTQQALKILENEQQTWSELVQYVRNNKVDCDLWVGDTLDIPMNPEIAGITNGLFERFKAAGGKVDHIKVTLDPAEAAEISRIKDAQACYAWPASTLYPWKLAAHIMRDNLEKGANLQTNTKVTGVRQSLQSAGKWRVQSDRGEVECAQVVHATNAYSSALEPSLRGLIRPSPHICNKVIPPVTFAGSKGLQNSYGVLVSGGVMFSINPRGTSGEDTVLFGGANPGQEEFEDWVAERPERCADDGVSNFKPVSDAIEEFAESQFPQWTDDTTHPRPRYDDGWSGVIALSADSVPFIGEIPGLPGQWVCAGHQGHGMARIFTAAPGLVKLMAGQSWANTHLPDVYEITVSRIERLKSNSRGNAQRGLGGNIASLEVSSNSGNGSRVGPSPRL